MKFGEMLYNQIIERCCYAKVGNCLNAAEEALLTAHARVQELEGKLDKEYLRFEDLAIRKATLQCELAEKDREIERLKAINKNDREYCSYEKILETEAALDVATGALKGLWKHIESGMLCRDISKDHEANWSLKMIALTLDLKKAHSVLESPAIAKRQK